MIYCTMCSHLGSCCSAVGFMYVASRFLLPGAWRHTAVAGLDRTRSPPRYYGTGCGGGVLLLAALVGLGRQAGEPEGRLLLLGGFRLLVRRDEL